MRIVSLICLVPLLYKINNKAKKKEKTKFYKKSQERKNQKKRKKKKKRKATKETCMHLGAKGVCVKVGLGKGSRVMLLSPSRGSLKEDNVRRVSDLT